MLRPSSSRRPLLCALPLLALLAGACADDEQPVTYPAPGGGGVIDAGTGTDAGTEAGDAAGDVATDVGAVPDAIEEMAPDAIDEVVLDGAVTD